MNTFTQAIYESFNQILDLVEQLKITGKGTRVIGNVEGRSSEEDQFLEIDLLCQEIVYGNLQRAGLEFTFYSEHDQYAFGNNPSYQISIDPFDGTMLYKHNLHYDWWSVLTYVDLKTGESGAFAVDLIKAEFYESSDMGVKILDRQRTLIKEAYPADLRSIGNTATISGYLMLPSYLNKWTEKLSKVLDKFPGMFIWPNGGSCIYPLIGSGVIHAYIMFDEPRNEIDAGLGFAQRAKFPVKQIDQNGIVSDYLTEPDKRFERIPCLIAACNNDLLNDLISYL